MIAIGLDGSVDDRHRIGWYALAEPLMQPTFVEVARILAEKRREALVVDEHLVIKCLSACAAHESPLTSEVQQRR